MDLKDKKDSRKNNKNTSGDKIPGGSNTIVIFLVISVVATLLFNMVKSSMEQLLYEQIPYSKFISMVDNGSIEKVELISDRIYIYPKVKESNEDINTPAEKDVKETQQPSSVFSPDFFEEKSQLVKKQQEEAAYSKIYYTGIINDPDFVERLNAHPEIEYLHAIQNKNVLMDEIILPFLLPIGIFYLIFSLFMGSISKKMTGRGGFMSIGQSNAKVYIEKKTGVVFADVAGQEEAKESLKEIVDFLHNPDKYTAIGAKQPKGALLVGPPGTGKTLLAKAVAGEANVTFFSLSGSDFVEMFVGVGASRVRDLFKQATEQAPCIIFIDEVDAIGKSRDTAMGGGNDEREQTLNQLLAEMDGFDSSKGVVILAATNRPEVLDKALLRPGRFDRRIIVEKPDLKGREAILEVHAKKVKMGANVDLKQIALATSGAVGADLANIINEAALLAVKMEKKEVLQEHLMEAVEVIIAGKEKKDRILTEKDKRLVAFHEVGHALATAIQKNSQPVQKITIVPRTMGSLGYILQMPEEERFIMTKDEILDQITVCLAGRAAEEVEFDLSTTGASNDIERATKLARSMVTQYGMSEKFGMMGLESIESKYLDGRAVPTCSEQTGASVDTEIMGILNICHEKAKKLLIDNREALTKIAEYLISKESITGEEFMDILKSIKGEDFKKE